MNFITSVSEKSFLCPHIWWRLINSPLSVSLYIPCNTKFHWDGFKLLHTNNLHNYGFFSNFHIPLLHTSFCDRAMIVGASMSVDTFLVYIHLLPTTKTCQKMGTDKRKEKVEFCTCCYIIACS